MCAVSGQPPYLTRRCLRVFDCQREERDYARDGMKKFLVLMGTAALFTGCAMTPYQRAAMGAALQQQSQQMQYQPTSYVSQPWMNAGPGTVYQPASTSSTLPSVPPVPGYDSQVYKVEPMPSNGSGYPSEYKVTPEQ